MSLVENLVNQIAKNGLNGITQPNNFDLQDDTFAKLLDKQMNQAQITSAVSLGTMGAPAGLIIEPFDGTDFSDSNISNIEFSAENQLSKEEYINQPIEFKELDMGDYFSNLLKSNTPENTNFFNFAKKHATDYYNQQAKNLVMNTNEFVIDVLKN